MRFSTKSRYAIRAMIDLATHEIDDTVPRSDIAWRQSISADYLAQLFRDLQRMGLVEGVKGPGGGYRPRRVHRMRPRSGRHHLAGGHGTKPLPPGYTRGQRIPRGPRQQKRPLYPRRHHPPGGHGRPRRPHRSILRSARKASWGMTTLPTAFMRRLPAFCFSRSLRFLEMSPP